VQHYGMWWMWDMARCIDPWIRGSWDHEMQSSGS
jgi:hypothetical protein